MFELLADNRTRLVLYQLRGEDGLELDELAVAVAAREHDVAPDDVPADEIQRVKVSLHHHVLPKLHATELIDYDSRHHDIQVDRHFSLVEKYLDLASDAEPG